MASVLIAGAGIAGLAAARALALDGHRVVVLEREDASSSRGAALLLPPAAATALARLGLGPVGHELDSVTVVSASGRVLGRAEGRRSVPRAVLVALLRDSVPASVELRYGRRFNPARPPGDRIVHDGDRFDLLVGADGIRSAVRAAIAPAVVPRPAGQACWRGIVPLDTGACATETWAGGERIGVVPLGDGATYVYLVLAGASATARWPAGAFTRCPGRDAAAVAALAALPDERLVRGAIEELRSPVWGSGRTVLVGDAAHAMTPNLGQGAATALADALALARALEVHGPQGFRRAFERARTASVRRLMLASRAMGRLSHLTGPAVPLRDLAMRVGAAARDAA